jgi:DNA-binding beta-propeller fold protein YncE
MTRQKLATIALFAAASLAAPSLGHAQTFKTNKYDIKGDGGTDYLTAEAGTGRVFVSRSTHVMVVDGVTGKVLGDIPTGSRNHGIALAPKANRGFITVAGDTTVVVFDLKTLAVVNKIQTKTLGHDGIMYDDASDRIMLTNHSNPGTLMAIDPNSMEITGTAVLEDNGPEGAVGNGKGKIYVNNENKHTIQVIDVKTMKGVASWPTGCEDGPTGIAYDRPSDRIFAGCGNKSVVVDGTSGKVVATIANGDGVDALGYDPSEKLIYIPSGAAGNVTVAHQDSPDKYTVVATVTTTPGAKTIAVDPGKHMAYVFNPEYGPAPAPAAGSPPPTGRGRGPRGPMIGAWLVAIIH